VPDLAAADLYQRLMSATPPRVLDVRNAEEFARWRVEGPRPVDLLNVPYFEFVEREEASVGRVGDWLGTRPGGLVVVCAEGGSSAYVAEILNARGLAADNLAGGMVGWGLGTVTHRIAVEGAARVWQVLRFGRGCLSYVVARGEDAVVVDPHRGLDTYRAILERERLRLRAVFDTHLHADHVSGGPALARDASVAYHASPRDFEGGTVRVEALTDGQPVRIASLEVLPIVPIGTPGHTPGSTSLLVARTLLLTGDTLFVDDVGRPDLGGQAAAWARDLHRTLHERLASLGDPVAVLPAHASALAAAGPDGAVTGTLGGLRRRNRAMRLDLETFVREAERAAGSAPPDYARIRSINLGRETAPESELTELELGRNQCALSRR
jgi:glyoxylase-like metal-dependent hydrolase (beta-lactamase superfamily II)/rhodanese-related sulfurtransferase